MSAQDPLREALDEFVPHVTYGLVASADHRIAHANDPELLADIDTNCVRCKLDAALPRQDEPGPTRDELIEAVGDIADLSKGEPRMSGGATFPANAHRMGRIHNRARKVFGEDPLTIENAALSRQDEPGLDARIVAFAKALFKEVPLCTGCDFDHGWDDHVLAVWNGSALHPSEEGAEP